MGATFDGSYRFIRKIELAALLLSLLIASLACAVSNPGVAPSAPPPAYQVPSQVNKPPTQLAKKPSQPASQPSLPAVQDAAGMAVVVGGWYGPACDEAEGTFIYRWSVDLLKNSQTGQLAGTVKFHACPGGGRVLYRVTGKPSIGTVFTLEGEKKDGGGDLFDTAAEDVTFTFDSSTGQLSPNLTQE
jgi:hypothetical protein